MNLIVLTSDQKIASEAAKINALFDNGMQLLHLRKPGFEIKDYRRFLLNINPAHYSKIVTHQAHELCIEFSLKGIHLQEQFRVDLVGKMPSYVDGFRANGYTVSTSFHSRIDIQKNTAAFDYVFLSPVFDSISKADYKGKGFNVTNSKETIIGMGGINAQNIQQANALGFEGVGVLGGIWESDDYLTSFIDIKKVCDASAIPI